MLRAGRRARDMVAHIISYDLICVAGPAEGLLMTTVGHWSHR